jgi:hypothetical protein
MPDFNALNPVANIQSYAEFVTNHGAGMVNPEVFYSKQLLDTIRLDAGEFCYFRYAESAPIQEKADKLMVRRWAPLHAHTVPLVEGTPPQSDKGSVEKYELTALAYGRYMEFTDRVNLKVVDPVIAHYTKEYSLVAIETLDMLAREALMTSAQKYYAGGAADFEALTTAHFSGTAIPTIADLRLIILSLKKALVKPRSNGKYHVIGSAEFYYDLMDDPYVETYMQYNQTTQPMYSGGRASIPSMFDMEFYETLACPTSGRYVVSGVIKMRYLKIDGTTLVSRSSGTDGADSSGEFATTGAFDHDSRTTRTVTLAHDLDANWIPEMETWTKATETDVEFKVQHILILGKDALLRTGISGEDQAKMYVKPLGSSGVLDPIDQRQSIGFKINSVGFGSTRLEAIVDYICIPSQVNV